VEKQTLIFLVRGTRENPIRKQGKPKGGIPILFLIYRGTDICRTRVGPHGDQNLPPG